jgi:putative membrane protein
MAPQFNSILVAQMLDLPQLLGALIYSLIGIGLFGLAFFIIVKVAPFSIRKEIEEDQNTSLGIIIGSVIIGIAMIISSAVQG